MFNYNIIVSIFDETNKRLWFKSYNPKRFAITKIAELAQDSFHRSLIYKELLNKRQKFKMEVSFNFEIRGDGELKGRVGRPQLNEIN